MKRAAAILCLLASLAFLYFSIDAAGSPQDAPPDREQVSYELPFAAGFVLFGAAGVGLLIWHVQQKRFS